MVVGGVVQVERACACGRAMSVFVCVGVPSAGVGCCVQCEV